jgi:hypothetical protein
LFGALLIPLQCQSRVFIVRLSVASKRRMTVEGLMRPRDIASSTLHRCLYAMEEINDLGNLFVVSPSDGSVVRRWAVDGTPANLTVASVTGNVIVACAKDIREYTYDGQLVRTVPLSKDMTRTWHAVLLANNDFIVCQVRVSKCFKRLLFLLVEC